MLGFLAELEKVIGVFFNELRRSVNITKRMYTVELIEILPTMVDSQSYMLSPLNTVPEREGNMWVVVFGMR